MWIWFCWTGLYYGVSICLVSFASGLSVVTLNVYHRGVRGTGVPPLIKTLVLHHIARLVFLRFEPRDKAEHHNHNVSMRNRWASSMTARTQTVGGSYQFPSGARCQINPILLALYAKDY